MRTRRRAARWRRTRPESEREAWFEAQRVIKEKQEEKKEAKQEKQEKEEEKKEEEEAKKAAMIPVERERVVAADADSEWFVSPHGDAQGARRGDPPRRS